MTQKDFTPEQAEAVASKVTMLLQFSATLVEDIDMLKEVAKGSASKSSMALTAAPIIGAMGGDYEEVHMEAEVKRKRAAAILNLVEVINDTEHDREDFKKKQQAKQEGIAQLRAAGVL